MKGHFCSEGGKKRGKGPNERPKVPNFIFVKGCKPGAVVGVDSKLIRDSLKNIFEQYEKGTLTLTFPDIIDKVKGTDSNIEIIKSRQL